jgi:glycosyltransferase involved in cell wall biosynthesis
VAKILLALHQFFPRFYTGTETLVLEVAQELRTRGHAVVIIHAEPSTPDHPGPDQPEMRRAEYEGFPVWRVFPGPEGPPRDRLDRESWEDRLVPLYEKILGQEKPEIVHAFHFMRLTLSFAETVKQTGIPLYFTTTDFWPLCPTYQLLKPDHRLCDGPNPISCFQCLLALYAGGIPRCPWHLRLGIRFPRLAVACSPMARVLRNILRQRVIRNARILQLADGVLWSNEFLKDMFACNGLTAHNQRVVPFPVPQKASALFDLPAPAPSDTLNIAFIGSLTPSKGPQIVIEAVTRLAPSVPIRLHVWGAALKAEFLDHLRRVAGNDARILFRGTFPQEQFADVLRDMDILAIPSLWYENTPLTALSGLAARRILVASDIGGLSSLIRHGQNGFLFPPGDVLALVDLFATLARDKRVLAKMARAITPPGTVRAYVDEIESCYESSAPNILRPRPTGGDGHV